MGFDPLTLALAKKYTDKVFENGGAGGGTTKPVTLDGEVIYPITTLPFEVQDGVMAATVVLDEPLSLDGGEAITVVFGEQKYETRTMAYYDNGLQVAFGNISFAGMGADTGEPFIGVYVNDIDMGTLMMIMTVVPGTSHTFGIAKNTLSTIVDMSSCLGDFIEGVSDSKAVELSDAQIAAYMTGFCKKDMLITYKVRTTNNENETTINKAVKPLDYNYWLFPLFTEDGTEYAPTAAVTFIAGENGDQIITMTVMTIGVGEAAETTIGLTRRFLSINLND